MIPDEVKDAIRTDLTASDYMFNLADFFDEAVPYRLVVYGGRIHWRFFETRVGYADIPLRIQCQLGRN